jgi:predicted PurR-regulated permease PerM
MLFSGFVSIRNIYDNFGETIATLYQIFEIIFYLIFVVYIYMTFDYVRYLINEKCKCSEGISRDVIMIGTIIELFLFLIIFLTGIVIPIITEGVSSLINNIGKFKDDIKENVDDPFKSAMNTPNKIRKSAKDISKLLKKSVKDLKRISKPSLKSKGSRR